MSEYQGYSQASPEASMPQNSTLAIVSLVSGIVTWILLPLVGAIVAVITGHLARKEIRESMGQLTGNGMAMVGLISGYIQLVLTIILPLCAVCVIVILALLGPSIGNVFSDIVMDI